MPNSLRAWIVVVLILCAAIVAFIGAFGNADLRLTYLCIAVGLLALAYLNDYAGRH